jgi:hypothetical protein
MPVTNLNSSIIFNLQPLTCNSSSTQAPYKGSKMTRSSHLKGSRMLQNFGFSGGIISGTSGGGGTGTGTGSAETSTADDVVGVADATGSGEFTTTSGSSGFIETALGSATGTSAGGATGSQAGNVGITLGGLGTLTFEGTTESSGAGGFGGGISPVQFSTVVTEVPGTAIPETAGSPKKGGSTGGGVTAPTFITTVVPVSTGPTGGFGTGSGTLDIASTTTGTLMAPTGLVAVGVGTSGGEATSFGGGSANGANFFGSAGGLGSGAGTGAAAAAGITEMDATNAIFTGTGGATGTFNNQGSGIFGTSQTLAFP